MDGMDYCEECEREHREEVKELMEQLKRKEQECETLASQLDFEVQKKECLEQECERLKGVSMQKCPQCGEVYLNPIGCELYEQLDQLKAENEKLKEILNEGCLHNLTLMTEKRVLLQTLTEIKEIALSVTGHFPDGEIFARPEIEQILQKISEVEDGI